MNRAVTVPLLVFLGWLVYAFFGVPAESRFAQETSIPEPTQLYIVALADSS